jgi:hypothetical protein
MQVLTYLSAFTLIFSAGCFNVPSKDDSSVESNGFVLKETIATGDTGYYKIPNIRKTDIREDLCQQWEDRKANQGTSADFLYDENGNPVHPQYNFYKDGTVTENPRHHIRVGKWSMPERNILLLEFSDHVSEKFIIDHLNSRQLRLVLADNPVKQLNLSSDGIVHRNMYNDPFHPVNNQWRIPPEQPESDSLIKQRAIDCIKFYALYYRDHLKRDRSVIDFEGLPKIFIWYNGGIGLPDRDDLDNSWINCFYNKEEAYKAHYFLRRLIKDYEYDWPKKDGKIDWWHRTHSVLEQMYHRANKNRAKVRLVD